MRVAAVQVMTSLQPGDNRRLVADLVDRAAGEDAELVVLPEGTICTFGPPTFDLGSVAEELDGPFVTELHAAASRHRVVAVAGMFERAEGGRVFNTAVAVGPDGVLAAYRKVHLFDALGARESDRVAPGDPAAVVTFPVGDQVAGIMTCYDLRFPEIGRALVDRGATTLVVPAHWYNGRGKAEVWDVLVRARAIESTAYVVAAGKPEPECVGRSAVVDPAGEVLAVLGGSETGMAMAEVSAARIAEVRAALPVLEHRRYRVEPAASRGQSEPAGRSEDRDVASVPSN